MNNKIYTKKGDLGETSILGGEKVLKSDKRVDFYGDLDELNSWLGLIKSKFSRNSIDHKDDIEVIQKSIFQISALVASRKTDHEQKGLGHIEIEDVIKLEILIDNISKELSPLKEFIIPGSSNLESTIHIARTICRRVERKAVLFYEINKDELYPEILSYLNRLSDYLFVLSRLDY